MPYLASRKLLPPILALAAALPACGGSGISIRGPYGIIGLVVLVAQIWAIVEVIQSGRDTVAKVIWIVAILLLPAIGAICWFIFGRR